jgi:hypothetical protein
MTYEKNENIAVAEGFGMWFDELTSTPEEIIDDILPEIEASGLHEYNGISPDWRFTYTGRGIF